MEAMVWKVAAVMRKISFRGNNWQRKDDGSILGFTVFLLIVVVAAVGLILRVSYAEFKKAQEEYQSFVVSQDFSKER